MDRYSRERKARMNARSKRDYAMRDSRRDYRESSDMRRGTDGHYERRGRYEPIEAMGHFTGYYGNPDRRGDYADRYYRDRSYEDYGDYDDYESYGDYGETLSEEELKHWCTKLKEQLSETEKQMFSKESIVQKARHMGKSMEGFGEKELEVATLMMYTDYKHTIGQNLDMSIMLAFDWLNDKDVAVKGAEKLAVYYDCIVEGQ